MIITIVSIVFAVVYFIFSVCLLVGWKKYKKAASSNKIIQNDIRLSLIIPFQSEIENISILAKKIVLDPDMEVLFINDSKQDNVAISLPPQIKIIKNPYPKGKKQALKYGIENAKGDWIVQTDIDCVFDGSWLKVIKETICQSEAEMLILPVLPLQDGNFLQKCFSLEFLSLVGAGLSFAALQNPFLCNGAALVYKKEIFEVMLANDKASKQYFKHFSGDDIFLLQHAKKSNYKITAVSNKNLAVETAMPKTILAFFKQRLRWASKAKYYQDALSLWLSVFIFAYNLLLLILLINLVVFGRLPVLTIVIWALKIIVDFIFLRRLASFFSRRKFLNSYPFVVVIYPIYIVVVALLSQIKRGKRW